MKTESKTKRMFYQLKTQLSPNQGWKFSASVVGLIVAMLLLLPIRRGRANASLDAVALPSVAVAKATRADLDTEMTIPAEFRPYAEVELHAKVSGFLQRIDVDIGDQVKAGQALATLEVPELQDELNNAMALKQRAEADYKNAHLAYTRLLTVDQGHPNLVAQQELDAAEAKDAIAAAAIAAAKAEMGKYQTLVAYTKITAPFAGVVTHRYADPGALIQSGTASQSQSLPLVRLSDIYRLRLDFPVSVDFVQSIQVGAAVDVRVESLGDRTFRGRVSRFTHQVDDQTRTMLAELEVNNPDLAIVPGMYAKVALKVAQRPLALAIPIEAVVAGKKTVVNVVTAGNEIEERIVTLGLETATQYEVVSGLKEGDLVMLGNPGQLKPGQKVEAKLVSLIAAQ
ncbi:MAG: efflux RND transporter periplasmic adaptor subunit [Verrucomicrobiota bacterium]|nr:efflux RND transporter periplasmic adaptor subunit [Verrucomicrobiota bacterium]MCC6821246.1 efflux RND transporter periplasmic adaptor subunit [Limisphaerales bacterium]